MFICLLIVGERQVKQPANRTLTRFPALLSTGMHGTEHRIEKR